MYRLKELRSSEHLSISDFIRVVLIRTFPGALSRLICHDFARFVLLRTLRGVNSYGSSAKLDSLEIISGAAFHIIGLTIVFLPLD